MSEKKSEMMKICGISHGVTAVLMPMGKGVGLSMNFFGQFDFIVMISDDLNHWPNDLDQNGIALGLFSGLKKCAGPM